MLPASLPKIEGLSVAGYHQPCREIGGDYYDAFRAQDGSLVMVVADNEGKGIAGALLMVQTRSLLHVFSNTVGGTKTVVQALNRELVTGGYPIRFVTMLLCRLNLTSRTLTFCNAGHCPAFVVHQGQITALNAGGLVLGIEESVTYDEGSIQLESGDTVLLYTDGITEAFNPESEVFGFDRLRNALLSAARSESAEEVLAAVNAAVADFRMGRGCSDDIAMLCVRVL